MTRAVVFAYHTIGVRCLDVLLTHGIDVALVVTHRDNPQENIWFESVAALASARGLPCIMPEDPNDPAVVAQVRACRPDFIFSFYYRHMLGADLLALPARGAYNLHGSLLPHYRGRVPVNWAVIHGERETGATLHAMTVKPDQGDIVAQERVPIGPDDTAFDVFQRVTEAGVKALQGVLDSLVAGSAPHRPQNLAAGSYFGGRRPQDGRIDWSQPAAAIHNLVRGVAPPYPGAFTTLEGRTARILRTSLRPQPNAVAHTTGGDGATLYILSLELEGVPIDAAEFKQRYPAGVRPA
ncbi:MAG: formyltransferase [Betaproteobacteria bacterium]|nr:formyltransferase [Betaproteobacteria bacterium]